MGCSCDVPVMFLWLSISHVSGGWIYSGGEDNIDLMSILTNISLTVTS